MSGNSHERIGKKQECAMRRPDGCLFVPIGLHDWVEMMAERGENRKEMTRALEAALSRYRSGARCDCGTLIWVIGSSILGNTCFTCATLESDSSEDYELEEAFEKPGRKHHWTKPH